MSRTIWLSLPCLLLIAGLAGCGGGTGIPTGDVSGTITINGEPVQGVTVKFVPDAKMRYSIGETDARGRYSADFVRSQSGVVLGGCTVEFSIFRGDSMQNHLPAEFNSNPPEHDEFRLDITKKGQKFDYDIKYDGEIPPYTKPSK
jgi:hypothetical protein